MATWECVLPCRKYLGMYFSMAYLGINVIFALYFVGTRKKVLEESKCGNIVTIGGLCKGDTWVCCIILSYSVNFSD